MTPLPWTFGTNLFSGWRDETEAEQREKWRRIEDYEEVNDFLLEGVWSRDPETRRRELETYNYETAVLEVKAEIARRLREVPDGGHRGLETTRARNGPRRNDIHHGR